MRNGGLAMMVCCGIAMMLPSVASGAAAPPTITQRHYACISHDRQPLDGILSYPNTRGKRPIVVIPGVWPEDVVAFDTLTKVVGEYLALHGYATFAYSQRGFGGSGGLVDGGGPLTVADVSAAIDCVAREGEGDLERVGTIGNSYGGAIGLLAAARDPRIKAVVSTSGWGDVNAAFYPNQTRRGPALVGLVTGALFLGRIDPELFWRMFLAQFNIGLPDLLAYGQPRSAKTYVAQINANKPAIMISQNFDDSLFDPNQAKAFYNMLTGPKRLQLQPGDHITAESDFPDGTFNSNPVWRSAFRWLDRYVKGDRNGIDTERPVQVDPFGAAPVEGYVNTDESAVARTFTLGARDGAEDEGSMVENGPAVAWTWPIFGGRASKADNGVPLLTGRENFAQDRKTVAVAGSSIDHQAAGV